MRVFINCAFSCGWIGHPKNGIQSRKERTTCMEHDPGAHSHAIGVDMLHEIIAGEGTLQQAATGTSNEDNYGPWLVINRKKSGSKSLKRGSVHASSSLYNEERTKSLSEACPRPNTKNRGMRVWLG